MIIQWKILNNVDILKEFYKNVENPSYPPFKITPSPKNLGYD